MTTASKALAFYNNFSRWLQKSLLVISGLLIGLSTAIMVIEVVTRYFFSSSHSFMDEIPRYLVSVATFLAAPVMLKLNKHVSVEILPEVLKGKKRCALMVLINLLTLAACTYMLLAGLSGFAYHYRVGTVSSSELQLPLWILMLFFSIGCALLTMFAIDLTARSIAALARHESPDGEGKS